MNGTVSGPVAETCASAAEKQGVLDLRVWDGDGSARSGGGAQWLWDRRMQPWSAGETADGWGDRNSTSTQNRDSTSFLLLSLVIFSSSDTGNQRLTRIVSD